MNGFVLPSRWKSAKLGELFDVQQGKALSQKSRQGDSPQPFLRTANVFWGHLNLTVVDRMDFTPGEAARLALQSGDLLLCEGGEIGRTAIWNGELPVCYHQNHVHRLRAKELNITYSEFYMFWMQAAFLLLNLYLGQGNKTTIANLPGARLKAFDLPLPPLPEQHAIAHALRSVQEAKEARRRELGLERERKAALMQHLFTHGTRGEPLKETEIGLMPESWRVVSIGDAFNFTRKPPNVRYTSYEAIPFVPMDYVPTSDLFFTRFSLRPLEELTSGTYFEPGDFLLAKITPSFENGKQGIISELPTPFGIATTEVIPIQGIPQVSSNVFLAYYLLQSSIRAELASKMEGTTGRQRLSKSVLVSTRIPLPSLPEQNEIIEVFSTIDSKIASLTREVETLDELFRAMLDELMTGRLSALPLVEGEKEPGAFLRAGGLIPWQEGDESSEVVVRRMRGHE